MRKFIPIFAVIATLGVAIIHGAPIADRRVASVSTEAAQVADPYTIADFNYKLSDITAANVTKETLFDELDPDRVILQGNSVCSNRAITWTWNMKRRHNIDSGKVIVFYSKGFFTDPEYLRSSGGDKNEKEWWYHIAPYIVENGTEWVLDHGFNPNVSEKRQTPAEEITRDWKGPITRPLKISEWLLRFPKTTGCKELTAADTSYTEYMRRGWAFPHPKKGGAARCYFRKIPMYYWTPLSVAMKELGINGKGVKLDPPFTRDNFWESDILTACTEAVNENNGLAKRIGFADEMATCVKFMGLDLPVPAHAPLTPLNPSWSGDAKMMKLKEKALQRLDRNY